VVACTHGESLLMVVLATTQTALLSNLNLDLLNVSVHLTFAMPVVEPNTQWLSQPAERYSPGEEQTETCPRHHKVTTTNRKTPLTTKSSKEWICSSLKSHLAGLTLLL
jgi:hypothetical protein